MSDSPAKTFWEFLDRPLEGWGRIVLLAACVPLVLAGFEPLYRISLEAPQYPEGLWVDVYATRLAGGNEGQHLEEINTLNHYIGMHPIAEEDIPDLGWMPFAFGLLLLLTLRVVLIGNVRALFDHAVLTVYTLGFFAARFVYRLYVYGHDLDPEAAVTIEPFMPGVIGTKQIANFTTHNWPRIGSLYLALFAAGVVAVLVAHLVRGRRAAREAVADEAEGHTSTSRAAETAARTSA